MGKRVTCTACNRTKVRASRIFWNKDGTKNTSSPWVYACLFLGLGIAVIPQIAEQWQALVASLSMLAGGLFITGLIIYRSRLASGTEFFCPDCAHRWVESKPIKMKGEDKAHSLE